MSLAKNATGTLFKTGSGASATGYTTIPECHRITGPDVRTDLNDVTSHDSAGGFREFLPGLHDGDQVVAELHWVPSNTVHQALRDEGYASTLKHMQLIFPDASENQVDFTGYIVGFPPQANVGEPLRNTVTVKVTGLPVWT